MVRECRAPCVQHERCTDPRAEVLRICGDADQRLGSNVEQHPVDHRLVLIGDRGDRRRQREDDVVVLHRQQIGLARFEPALSRTALALRAVAIATRVVGDLVGAAAVATQDVSAQRRAAALFDGRHDLELRQAQVRTLLSSPGGTVLAEDVGDFKGSELPHAAGLHRIGRVQQRQRLQRAEDLAQ